MLRREPLRGAGRAGEPFPRLLVSASSQSQEFTLTSSFLSTGSAGSRPGGLEASPGSPVYLDLAYLPSGGSACLVDEEFFRRVRALCYVISGQGQHKEEGMRAVLDALLAGKQQWDRDLQVCDHSRASGSLGAGWGQRLLVSSC